MNKSNVYFSLGYFIESLCREKDILDCRLKQTNKCIY